MKCQENIYNMQFQSNVSESMNANVGNKIQSIENAREMTAFEKEREREKESQ